MLFPGANEPDSIIIVGLFILPNKLYKNVKAFVPLSEDGAYGVLLYGMTKGKTYTFYVYVTEDKVFGRSEEISVTYELE